MLRSRVDFCTDSDLVGLAYRVNMLNIRDVKRGQTIEAEAKAKATRGRGIDRIVTIN